MEGAFLCPEKGKKPEAKAERSAKDVEKVVWGTKPRAVRSENRLEGAIKALVRGYYSGHGVAEIRWGCGTFNV